MSNNLINPTRALFIKLGGSGLVGSEKWEDECISNGTLRISYPSAIHQDCLDGHWEKVSGTMSNGGKTWKGSATQYVNQLRHFYDVGSSENTLWITFHADKLYWCFAKPEVHCLKDKSFERETTDRWHCEDIKGNLLFKNRISGNVLATQGYRQTICKIKESELQYLINKINGTTPAHIEAVKEARDTLVEKLIFIIKNLHETDFEILVDLIFSQSGWRRVGVLGGIEKDIDLDLMSPLTNERIAVQIKSRAVSDGKVGYNYYKNCFKEMGYLRFYFVTHTPDSSLDKRDKSDDEKSGFIYWGPEEVAKRSVGCGLVGWLLDKAS